MILGAWAVAGVGLVLALYAWRRRAEVPPPFGKRRRSAGFWFGLLALIFLGALLILGVSRLLEPSIDNPYRP